MEKVNYRILILEGSLLFHRDILHRAGKPTRFTRQGINNLLRSLFYLRGIRVEFSENIEETATLVKELYRYFNSEHVSLYRRPSLQGEWGKPSQNERLMYFYQGLPGPVGKVLSEALVKHFPSPDKLVGASPEALQEINGIGKIIAGRIYEFLHKEGA